MADAHEHPRFAHATTYAVTGTVTVAGGLCPPDGHHGADKVAARLADAAARAAHVVDVNAAAGPVIGGKTVAPATVHFTRANTGPGAYGEPEKLSRYLDPDHERALPSRADATAQHQARRRADLQRRRAPGCHNAGRLPGLLFLKWRRCQCVYSDPALHPTIVSQPADGWVAPARRLCGVPAGCREHSQLSLVLRDHDPAALHDRHALLGGPPNRVTP